MKQTSAEKAHFTPYDDSYASCERTYSVLVIYADDLEPDTITQRLNIAPTETQKKGNVYRNSLGRTRVSSINGWFMSSEGIVQSLDLRRHLDWLLDRIEPSSLKLLELQRSGLVKMYVNCVWWMSSDGLLGGPTFWPAQMGKLATLNLECGLELAFFGDDEAPAS